MTAFDVSVTYSSEQSYDLADLIRNHRDEYLAVDLRGGYAEWERPMVFLTAWVTDEHGSDDVDFHWSEKRYDELVKQCPEAVVGDEAENPGPPCPACAGGRWVHEDGCMLESVTWVTDGHQRRSA